MSIFTRNKPLTYLEERIITAIAEANPYSQSVVEKVWRRCKSYDETIRLIEKSVSEGVDLAYIVEKEGY